MLNNAKSINLQHQRLWLLPQKAIYWQKKKTLLVADPHIGKSGHFRTNGIPVPQQVNTGNLDRLNTLINTLEPNHLVFLGDLFHSRINEEWTQFKEWRKRHTEIEVTLVIGNHDILSKENYHASHISIFKRLKMDPFYFVHNVEMTNGPVRSGDLYFLGGHIHPALQLKGKGRQKIKLPCFYFGQNKGILPAFGHFTGTSVIKPTSKDRIYIIVEEQVLPAGI